MKMWPVVFKSILKHLLLKLEKVETDQPGSLALCFMLKQPHLLLYHSVVIKIKGWIHVKYLEECLVHIKCHIAFNCYHFLWNCARRFHTNGFYFDVPVLRPDGKT